MALPQDHISMALFCDFENVALGVRDANYDKFDIKRVLERLLLKGSIVLKKAYCDWDRYKAFKAPMHEANFELIEIPHVRQSGKNSADIRLVVDALDLCYTKSHVNTFVIISGDSDFSPLVSKLRENAKYVIGVGVKQSTSDLLIANCDEFIFYDDLVRESQRNTARRDGREGREAAPQQRRTPEEERRRREEMDARRSKGVEMAVETYDALVTDRDDGGKIWASVLKEALKRRNPGFNENYYGFRTFGNLLEEAQSRGFLEFGRDEKSGAYVSRGTGTPQKAEPGLERSVQLEMSPEQESGAEAPQEARREPRQNSRRDGQRDGRREPRRDARPHTDQIEHTEPAEFAAQPDQSPDDHPSEATSANAPDTGNAPEGRRGNRGGRGDRGSRGGRNDRQANARQPARNPFYENTPAEAPRDTSSVSTSGPAAEPQAPAQARPQPDRQPREQRPRKSETAVQPERQAQAPVETAKPAAKRARKTATATSEAPATAPAAKKATAARKTGTRARPAAKKAATGSDQG